MKKIFSSIVCSTLIIGFTASISQAKTYYMKFNEKDSKITFAVSTTLHDFVGEAKKFKGNINLTTEGDNITKASGIVEINANNLSSHQTQRDDKMQTQTFSASKYPLITFKVNKAKTTSKLGADGVIYLKLGGVLRIRDAAKNIEIPVKVKLSPDKTSATVDGKYTVNFKDYNVPDPSLPIIGNVNENINISFNIKAH